ncbi:MAG: LamG domain-containing protein, partial [Patescibacteria group bacterium]|nr:LamG domain-containing protein [Patescibacteria group bacterium]
MSRTNVLLVAILGLATACVGNADASTVHSLFKPDQVASLGALNATTGTISINTDSLTFDFEGVRYGATAASQGGGVELAMFTFDSIHIGSGVTVQVTGNRGLVLASKSNFTFASTLDVAGKTGGSGSSNTLIAGGAGGSGAESGTPGGPTSSAPPAATRGMGGSGTRQGPGWHALSLSYGRGTGGATQQDTTNTSGGGSAGGGGAFGGAGGTGGGVNAVGPGGAVYGNDLLTELFGGSGGGGGRYYGDSTTGGGGGGGGAVELIAAGILTVSGTINVAGGIGGYGVNRLGGGGGSGGGVILAASTLDVTGAQILARGGNAHINPDNDKNGGLGGGGGGGRVAFYANQVIGRTAETVSVDGGMKGTGQFGSTPTNGNAGTFRHFGDGIGSRGELLYSKALADDPALVGHWKLDDAAGSATVADSKGSRNGTVYTQGVTLGQPAPMSTLGQSAHFNRAQQGRVEVAHNSTLNPEKLTVELWVKADSLSAGGGDYRSPLTSRGTGTGYLFYANNNNVWQYWVGNGASTGDHWSTLTGPSVNVGQWVHLVGTHDGTNQRFYMNGHLVASQTSNYAPNTGSSLLIGTGADTTNFAFHGNVADVAVMNAALDAQSIADHYNQKSNYASGIAAAAAPTAHWRLGEQAGGAAFNALNVSRHTGAYGNVTLRQMATAIGNDVDTAASFNGASSKVAIAYDAALNPASFTVEAWARAEGGQGGYRTVLSSRNSSDELNGYTLYANDANQWEFRVGTGATSQWHTTTGPAVALGEWVHLVGAYDAGTGTKTFYVDGLQVARQTGVSYSPNRTAANGLFIGMGGDSGTDFPFDGQIDEVALYGRALGSAAVNRHFLVARTGAELIHWIGDGANLEWNTVGNWHSGTPGSNIVVFGDARASATAGTTTSTVNANHTVASILYENRGNHHGTAVASGSTLTLAAAAGTPRIYVADAARIDGQLAGSQGLLKTGEGTLTLGGTWSSAMAIGGTGVTVAEGTLRLAKSSVGFDGGVFTAGTGIRVERNATLAIGSSWNLSQSNQVTVDGGTLHIDGAGTYLNHLTLTGASVIGSPLWIGHGSEALLTVSGNAASAISSGLLLVNHATQRTHTLHV